MIVPNLATGRLRLNPYRRPKIVSQIVARHAFHHAGIVLGMRGGATGEQTEGQDGGVEGGDLHWCVMWASDHSFRFLGSGNVNRRSSGIISLTASYSNWGRHFSFHPELSQFCHPARGTRNSVPDLLSTTEIWFGTNPYCTSICVD